MNQRGKSIHVTTPYGPLTHEVHLSLSEGRWLARIVTLPNQIWVEPGGKCALTFRAATAEEAETMAVSFIMKECRTRGQRVLDLKHEEQKSLDDSPATRLLGQYPLRFICRRGPGRTEHGPVTQARTVNLSETGLFIETEEVAPVGTRLTIDLRLPGLPVRLEGEVAWSRSESAPGRPPGMGVRLLDAPIEYRGRLQSLR